MSQLSCIRVTDGDAAYVRPRAFTVLRKDSSVIVCGLDDGSLSAWKIHLREKVSSLLPKGSGQGGVACLAATSNEPDIEGGSDSTIVCATEKSVLTFLSDNILPEQKRFDIGPTAVEALDTAVSASGRFIAVGHGGSALNHERTP